MSQDGNSPTLPDSKPLTWSEVWIRAITKPSAATFADLLARDPKPTKSKGYKWVFFSAIIAELIVSVITLIGRLFGKMVTLQFGIVQQLFLIFIGILIIFIIVIGIIFVSHLISRVALGGKGTYDQLAYLICAYSAPLLLVSSVFLKFFNLVTDNRFITDLFSLLVYVYGIALQVVAVKVVYQFGWGKAIIPVIPIAFIVLCYIWDTVAKYSFFEF